MEPDFSIIIPTRNRPMQIAACLRSLEVLDYPRDRFEVIVVDDGSEPPVNLPGIRFIRQSPAGPATARNTGVAQARGRILAFTDDDCAPASDWLRTLAARVEQRPGHLVGGAIFNALPDNACSTASQLLVSYLYTYFNAEPDRAWFFTSNNMAVPAKDFREAGGFDTMSPRAAGEDREFCDRWQHQGRPAIYAPEARVYHAHELTLPQFWRQHFNYGRGAHYYHVTRARRGGGPLRVEPFSFYADLLWYPFRSGHAQPVRQSALLFLAQAANALGFFRERWTA